jgi:hypothetical protein
MLCISVREPWATAIFSLGKNVENRTWRTTYRGRLCIHVSTGKVERADLAFLKLRACDLALPPGCIVGFVDLYGITAGSRSQWARRDCWHWLLRDAVLIEPVRWRGLRGLFRADLPLRVLAARH